jgi:hypothetical protein
MRRYYRGEQHPISSRDKASEFSANSRLEPQARRTPTAQVRESNALALHFYPVVGRLRKIALREPAPEKADGR